MAGIANHRGTDPGRSYKLPDDDERENYVEGESHVFIMLGKLNSELESTYEIHSRGISEVPVFTTSLKASG